MICENCRRNFEEWEMATVYEFVGEHFGFPTREEWGACPYCKSTNIMEEDEFYSDYDD